MCLTGCKSASDPNTGEGGTPANAPTTPCTTCSVSISPNTVKICSASATAALTATGSPAGGSFAWASSNTAAATVAGSGASATVTGVANGTSNITVTYTPPGCSPCSATVPAQVCICTSPSASTRFYSFAQKTVANLRAGKAKIKTRWGKLCCENLACTNVAMKCVYVNISNGGNWAQTGYRRLRSGGSTSNNFLYTEMNGATYKVKDDAALAPAEGSIHEYRVELDPATGTWTYYLDGTVSNTFADPNWNGSSGAVVQWPGEIINREDDMAGTSANKCTFTDCQYKVGTGAWTNAGLTAADLHTDDASEWANQLVSTKAFNIWDVKPNP